MFFNGHWTLSRNIYIMNDANDDDTNGLQTAVLKFMSTNTSNAYYRVNQKNFPTCFCQKAVKSPPNLTIFGTQMTKTIELCEVHPFSTSRNLRQRTTL